MNNVKLVPAYNLQEEIAELFAEYTQMLIEGDAQFKEYLAIQHYDDELQNLEKKYGMPQGRLYIAYYNNQIAGCIGMKKITSDECEMKRLYVRPQYRGLYLGNILVHRIIEDALISGYKYMLLDTLPFLQSAIHMYKKFGFYEIPCYNNSPMASSIYMKLELKNSQSKIE